MQISTISYHLYYLISYNPVHCRVPRIVDFLEPRAFVRCVLWALVLPMVLRATSLACGLDCLVHFDSRRCRSLCGCRICLTNHLSIIGEQHLLRSRQLVIHGPLHFVLKIVQDSHQVLLCLWEVVPPEKLCVLDLCFQSPVSILVLPAQHHVCHETLVHGRGHSLEDLCVHAFHVLIRALFFDGAGID